MFIIILPQGCEIKGVYFGQKQKTMGVDNIPAPYDASQASYAAPGFVNYAPAPPAPVGTQWATMAPGEFAYQLPSPTYQTYDPNPSSGNGGVIAFHTISAFLLVGYFYSG